MIAFLQKYSRIIKGLMLRQKASRYEVILLTLADLPWLGWFLIAPFSWLGTVKFPNKIFGNTFNLNEADCFQIFGA